MKTLLVVDDQPDNLALLRMVVEEADLPVELVTASNGLEAVSLARTRAPALVLMDLKMPVLDGWEATRRLKADPATADIPVVAFTAQAMVGDRERALAAGCEAYLTKPIDVRTLTAFLRKRLG
jgi:CheY-like chemotaxis protein